MADYIPNILIDPKLKDLADVSFVREDGEVNIMKTAQEKVLPFVTIGGDQDLFWDHASDKSEGTPIKTYDTGEVTNPFHTKPSSFFTPAPQNISTAFFGNPLFLANRTFLFGLLVLMKALKGGENKSYSSNYKVLPDLVIDNQELEAQLFGEI